ncbi:MAG TPA: MFS transporter, partial [Phenylobacterium sp.]|nr:MFS transporter [Phenylobacterium sp.]
KGALELYFSLYFWGLNQAQLSLLTVAGMIASVSGAGLAAPVAKRLGKRNGAIIMFAGAVVALVGPIFLRLIGLMPPNGSTALFVILFIDVILNGAMAIMTGVMLASMIADVVEESEVQTGRRSEGLLMSADNLFKKLVSGVGVFASGLVLAFAQFPQGAKRGEVPEDILHAMAWVYLPVILGFYSIAILGLFLFRIDRKTHEDNLAILRARAEAEAEIEQGRPPTLP